MDNKFKNIEKNYESLKIKCETLKKKNENNELLNKVEKYIKEN